MNTTTLAALTAIAVLLAPAGNAQDDILATSWTGQVYTIDSSTGNGSLLGSTGFLSCNSQARKGFGTFFVAAGGDLITVDPTTGAGARVGAHGLGDVRGLAYWWFTGRLYAVVDGGAGNDQLWTLDPVLLTKSYVGSIGFDGVQALTIGPGYFFGYEVDAWGTGAGLIRIDPTTGAGTDVNPALNDGHEEIQCLDYHANKLWGAHNNGLFTLDPTTGARTLVGTGSYYGIRGLDFKASAFLVVSYCVIQHTPFGCWPTIHWNGSPRLASSQGVFEIYGTNVRNNRSGMLIYSLTGRNNVPFHGGRLCLQSPIRRTILTHSRGDPAPAANCSGAFVVDLAAFARGQLGGNPAPELTRPGQVVRVQWWGRESPGSATLTNALEFTVQ